MSNFPVLEEIINKRAGDDTYSQGGMAYSFIKLSNGKVVEMMFNEPDVKSFRDDYYYNAHNNILNKKYAIWVESNFNVQDSNVNIVLDNGRIINNLVSPPDPKSYSDDFYYNSSTKKLYRKVIRWVQSNNI